MADVINPEGLLQVYGVLSTLEPVSVGVYLRSTYGDSDNHRRAAVSDAGSLMMYSQAVASSHLWPATLIIGKQSSNDQSPCDADHPTSQPVIIGATLYSRYRLYPNASKCLARTLAITASSTSLASP